MTDGDAISVAPRDQYGDFFVRTFRRHARGFDHAQNADRALERSPLIDDPGEEVATEQRTCSPPRAGPDPDCGY
jgi:hypothetical protein